MADAQQRRNRAKEKCLSILRKWGSVVVPVVLVVILSRTVYLTAIVPTASMVPTIAVPSFVFSLRTSYWFDTPQRGDIVLFHRNDGTETVFVKRVIGLPGETVVVKNGTVSVDGVELKEAYIAEEANTTGDGVFVVPDGEYFLMGDNRNDSLDSRFWAEHYVPEDHILSKEVVAWKIPTRHQGT